MRPASEIHSAYGVIQRDLDRRMAAQDAGEPTTEEHLREWDNLCLARDVLAWAIGEPVDLTGDTAWLAAYLLDDPPKLDSTPPEVN